MLRHKYEEETRLKKRDRNRSLTQGTRSRPILLQLCESFSALMKVVPEHSPHTWHLSPSPPSAPSPRSNLQTPSSD
jgi:hypothetical protein